MGSTLLLIGVKIGLSLLSEALREDETPEFTFDDTPTTLAQRGGFIPLVLGRRRVGPVFAWAGDRVVIKEGGSGGKGSSGGGASSGPPIQHVYHEAAWHILCVGPAEKLHQIYRNGEGQLPAPIDRVGTPSGSTVATPFGSFQIFWGECDQPLNGFLGAFDRVDVTSRWPHHCYVVWTRYRLSTSPRWPQVEYEIEVRVDSTIPVLDDSDDFIDETAPGSEDDGVNPGWALSQLLTGSFPHGVNIEPSRVDHDRLEELGDALGADTERLPLNILIQKGKSAEKVVGDILQDIGATLPQIAKQLVPFLMRVGGTLPIFDDTTLTTRVPTREFIVGGPQGDRLIYLYRDRTIGYRVEDLAIDDDAVALRRGVYKTKRLKMSTITDHATAVKIADRRAQEDTASSYVVTIELARQGRLLGAGQAFTIEGRGDFRVASMELKQLSSLVVIDAVRDFYSVPATGFSPLPPGSSGGGVPPLPDDPFDFMEMPFEISGGSIFASPIAIAVVRNRAHNQITDATLFMSTNASFFRLYGVANDLSVTGLLTEAIDPLDDEVIEDGPVFDADSLLVDLANVLDLTSDPLSWRQGRQLLFINDEIFFLRNITALGGTLWRLNGLIRKRMDTDREAHAITDRIWIADRSEMSLYSRVPVRPGVTLSVKTLPGANGLRVAIGDVTAVTRDLVGRAQTPLTIVNLRVNDQQQTDRLALSVGRRPLNQYTAGQDIEIRYNYRVRDGRGVTPEDLPFGQVIPSSIPFVPHEGEIIIEIVDTAGPTVVRTFTIATDESKKVYTNFRLVRDFSGEPASFEIRARNRFQAHESANRTITVTKV
jgi:hypothetical protein